LENRNFLFILAKKWKLGQMQGIGSIKKILKLVRVFWLAQVQTFLLLASTFLKKLTKFLRTFLRSGLKKCEN